ncbi:MAG TPA: hypothetical protein VG325_03420 [Solirubrobacteraceae bacterium]|nr:hypothetical protein [Solirubrobacteraceae bacterium]
MFGSLITRPLRIATRGVQITLHGAHEAIELAEGLVGLVTSRLIGDEGDHDGNGTAAPPSSEPPAWQGPAASSTSSPRDRPSSPPSRVRRRPPSRPATPPRAEPVTPTPAERATPAPPEPQTPAPAEPAAPAAAPSPAPPATGPTAPRDVARDDQSVAEIVNAGTPEPPMPEAEHVSEEPELVEEVAEPGAEDGAGAQIRIAEPWDGYRTMKAADVIDRLSSVSTEVLATVELYELAGRNRKSVVAAVQRALKQASPPR